MTAAMSFKEVADQIRHPTTMLEMQQRSSWASVARNTVNENDSQKSTTVSIEARHEVARLAPLR